MGSRRFQRCVPSTPGVRAAVPLGGCVGMTTSMSRSCLLHRGKTSRMTESMSDAPQHCQVVCSHCGKVCCIVGSVVGAPRSDSRPADMVGKALRLLTTLGELPGGATLSELSRAADYPTSTTFRLLGALARDGFVELDEATKRYRLGLTIFALGQRVSQAH